MRDAWLYIFSIGLVFFVGCAPVSATRPSSIPITSEPALHTVARDAQPVCATRVLTFVADSILPFSSNSPHTLLSATQDARTTIVAVNAEGESIPLTSSSTIGQIQLSMDGNALAYELIQGTNSANNQIGIRTLTSRNGWQVASGDGCAIFGFTLDSSGQRLAYLQVAMRGRLKPAAWQINIADLKTPENSHTLRGDGETALLPLVWSADALIYRAITPFQSTGRNGIWRTQSDGSNLRSLLRESDFVGEPRISADGRWLAYLASDPERLPDDYIAVYGEPPANRIAVMNLATGETRTMAETTASFGDLAWWNSRLFFSEGVWEENRFRQNRISAVQVDASVPQPLVTLATESISSVQACDDDSVVFSVDGAVRWRKNEAVKTIASGTNVEYRVLGCIK